jgi:hypothetical protein
LTLGDYGLKSALLVVEKMTMKSNTDAVKGKLYADDGAGLVLATAALAAVTKVVMANEDPRLQRRNRPRHQRNRIWLG